MNGTSLLLFALGGAFFFGLFLTGTVIAQRRRVGTGGGTIAILLLAISVNLVHPHIELFFPNLTLVGRSPLVEPVQFLVAPLLFLYVRHAFAGKVPGPLDLFHALPCVAVVVLSTLGFVARWEDASAFPFVSIVLWILLAEQSGAYFWLSIRSLGAFRRRLRALFSNTEGSDPEWLRWALRIYLFVVLSYALSLFLLVHTDNPMLLRAVVSLESAFLIWFIAIRVLAEAPRREPAAFAAGIENERPPVSREEEELLVRAILDRMERAHDYRKPLLGLSDLVTVLGFSRNEISWALNHRLKRSFYRLVNEYRVREVAASLTDESNRDRSIIDLAFAAGFNSKPTFQKVFKEFTGTTPSAFRRKPAPERLPRPIETK